MRQIDIGQYTHTFSSVMPWSFSEGKIFTGRFWDSFSGEPRFTYFGICSEVEPVCFGWECWGVAVVHESEAHVLIAGDEVI